MHEDSNHAEEVEGCGAKVGIQSNTGNSDKKAKEGQ
jgi:hypothetical protein